MQTFYNSSAFCSSSLGQALLEWYCILEDNACIVSASKTMLPKSWRLENVTMKELLAAKESRPQSNEIYVDIAWAEQLTKTPDLVDIVAEIPLLQSFHGEQKRC